MTGVTLRIEVKGRPSGGMADAFRVGQLPRDVQDRIFAFADGCLSLQHRGIPRVCKFWLCDRSETPGVLLGGPLCVLEEQWRAECARYETEDGAVLPCQTCGCIAPDLHRVEVCFAELTLHRRITSVAMGNSAWLIVNPQRQFELRDVCDVCYGLLWINR